MSTLTADSIKKLKVADLKVELGKLGLSKTGNKGDLVKRLEDAVLKSTSTKSSSESNGSLATKASPMEISDDSDDDSDNDEIKPGKRTKSSNGGGERKKRKKDGSITLSNSTEVNLANSDDKVPEFKRIRDGPNTACLEPFSKTNVTFSNENLEVQSNNYSYTSDYVKANVKINKRSWYYEVKFLSSRTRAEIGYCTTSFNPLTNMGDYWAYNVQEQSKQRFNQPSSKYGDYSNNGDIIGCALDIDSKSIKFFKNGKDLGIAFNDVSLGTDGYVTPFIILQSGVKLMCNFGKTPFSYPQDGYYSLHSKMTDSHLKLIGKLFTKYKDISNLDENGKTIEEPKDTIHGNGLIEFQKDLTSGKPDDEDPIMLIIAWKLRADTMWELSKDEFINSFWLYECFSIEKIKAIVKDWKKELKTKDNLFKNFYNFVFDYLREDKTILLLDEAIVTWNIILKEKKWGMYDNFIQFLKETGKKSISRDAWQQLWNFIISYPVNLKDYDKESCWPILYDDFVEWMETKDKEPTKEKSK